MPDKEYVCAKCGHDRFTAHQVVYCDVVVNGHGEFEDNDIDPETAEKVEKVAPGAVLVSMYEKGRPYGPFTCYQCGEEYDELSDAKQKETKDEK